MGEWMFSSRLARIGLINAHIYSSIRNNLKNAGFSSAQLINAGFAPEDSAVAALENPNLQTSGSSLNGIPSILGNGQSQAAENANSNQQLQAILNKQNTQMAEQKYQQKILTNVLSLGFLFCYVLRFFFLSSTA